MVNENERKIEETLKMREKEKENGQKIKIEKREAESDGTMNV